MTKTTEPTEVEMLTRKLDNATGALCAAARNVVCAGTDTLPLFLAALRDELRARDDAFSALCAYTCREMKKTQSASLYDDADAEVSFYDADDRKEAAE